MPSVLYPRGSRRPWRGGSKPLPAWAAALALGVLLVATGPALANDSGQVDNPYAAAGISDPTHVTRFLARLKQALAADDRAAVAAMVSYPLHVYAPGRGLTTYRDAATLRAGYAWVFTPEVTAAVATATPDSLFARDQGVMIGNGQVWINEVHAVVKIITININHTRRAAGTQQVGKSR